MHKERNLPSISISTTPPNNIARFLWTHMENPARGPGGIPLFFTYHQEKKKYKRTTIYIHHKGKLWSIGEKEKEKKSTLFHSQVLGSRDHISEWTIPFSEMLLSDETSLE